MKDSKGILLFVFICFILVWVFILAANADEEFDINTAESTTSGESVEEINKEKVDLDFITITPDNKEVYEVTTPFSQESEIVVSYNSSNNYICDCGGYITDYERINIRVQQMSEEDILNLKKDNECLLIQPETPVLLQKAINNIMSISRPNGTTSEQQETNIQMIGTYLKNLYSNRFTVEDVVTAYSIYDTTGVAYPLHAVWEVYTADEEAFNFKRLQATYIDYHGTKIMFRIVTNYEMYDFWFVKDVDGDGRNSIEYDYDTLLACVNASSANEIRTILDDSGYYLYPNKSDCIFKQTAPEYLYGLQSDIIIGDYME